MSKARPSYPEYERVFCAMEALSKGPSGNRSVTVPNGDIDIVLAALVIAHRATIPGYIEATPALADNFDQRTYTRICRYVRRALESIATLELRGHHQPEGQ